MNPITTANVVFFLLFFFPSLKLQMNTERAQNLCNTTKWCYKGEGWLAGLYRFGVGFGGGGGGGGEEASP